MILTTGELEAVPILLTQALAEDQEEWTIELYAADGALLGEGVITGATNWDVAVLLTEDEQTIRIAWDDVTRINIP